MNNAKKSNLYMLVTLLCFMFVLPVGSVVLGIIFPFLIDEKYLWLLQIILSIGILVLPMLLFLPFKQINFSQSFPFKRISFKNLILIILISFIMQPALSFVASITNLFHTDEISDVIDIFTTIPYWQSLLAIAVTPAIIEEFVFRGIILSGYKKTTLVTSILVSSLFFGLLHLNITQLFYTILGGIIFAFMVKLTKSIWAGVLGHFILNGTQITLAYVLANNPNMSEESEMLLSNETFMQFQPLISVLSSAILFLVSLPFLILFLYLFIKNNKDTMEEYKEHDKYLKENSSEKEKVFTPMFFIVILVYLLYIAFIALMNFIMANIM